MTPEFVIGFARQAIELTLVTSLPTLGVGLGVGVIASRPAPRRNLEATLDVDFKIIAVFVALLITFPWAMDKMITFTRDVFLNSSAILNNSKFLQQPFFVSVVSFLVSRTFGVVLRLSLV